MKQPDKSEEFRHFILSHIRSGGNLYAFLIVVISMFDIALLLWLVWRVPFAADTATSVLGLLIIGIVILLFFIYRYLRSRMPKRSRVYWLLFQAPTQIKNIRQQVISGRYTYIINKRGAALPQMLTFSSKNKASQFKSYVNKLLPQVEIV